MIKRTPQEIADFFNCYIAQNPSGLWYAFCKKPHRNKTRWAVNPIRDIYISTEYIDNDWEGDWKDSLHEPSTKDAAHISEVHTHMEYRIISNKLPNELAKEVTRLLSEGWKPYGGIVVEQLKEEYADNALFHQTMVRGIE